MARAKERMCSRPTRRSQAHLVGLAYEAGVLTAWMATSRERDSTLTGSRVSATAGTGSLNPRNSNASISSTDQAGEGVRS